MRNTGLMAAALAVALAAPISGPLAQSTSGESKPFSAPTSEPTGAQTQNGTAAPDSPNQTVEAYEGADVYGSDGDKVANLKKIVKEPAGKSDHAVLTVGSIFGFGGKDVRVPLNEIYVGEDGHLEVAMTESELEEFPPVVETQ